MGAGVFDILLDKGSPVRDRILGLDNASRSLDRDNKHKKKLLKEDMYLNMLSMLEQKKLKLLDDDEIVLSLSSIQYEYVSSEKKATRFRVFGSYSHIAEGLVRAAWLIRNKPLNIWVR